MDHIRRRHLAGSLSVALLLSLGTGCTAEMRKARSMERADAYYEEDNPKAAIIEYRNVLKYEEGNTHAIQRLGLLHFRRGELGQAYAFLSKAKELDPTNTEVRLSLGTIYLLGRQPETAREEAEYVLSQDPDNLSALALMADSLQEDAELDEAIARIEEKKATLGEPGQVGRVLAALYLRKGDLDKAEEALQESLQAANSAEARFTLARIHIARGELDSAEKELRGATEAAPDEPVAQLRLADFYLRQGKIPEAKAVLGTLTSGFADYLPAWQRTAEVAIAETRYDDARTSLDAVFERSPEDRTGLMLLGQVQLNEGEVNEALLTYQRVLSENPQFSPARVQLAMAHVQAGSAEQAKSELRQALDATPHFAPAVFLLSDLNIQAGAADVATEDLQRFMAEAPNAKQPQTAARAYELLGTAYLRRGQAARATAEFRKRLELAPADPKGRYLLANGLAAEGKTAEARRILEALLTEQPAAVEPLNLLVGMDFQAGRADAALTRTKRQIEKVPDSALLYFVLAKVHERRAEVDLAVAAYKRSSELDTAAIGPHRELARIYGGQGRLDEALAALDAARAIDANDVAVAVLTGMLHQQRENYQAATEAYELALGLSPRNAVALNNLAWIMAHKVGDQDKALELAQRAKEVSPGDPSVSDTLGWILYQRGIYQRAASLLEEASERLPRNEEIRYHYGMALLKTGDREGARRELTQALANQPSFDGVDEARVALSELN